MLILHGENTVQSRNRLFQLSSHAKEKNVQILHLDAKTLDIPTLEDALGSTSLFGEEKVIIIEELHSLPKSKRKDELIQFLSDFAQTESLSPEVILWEKRDVTATMLKKFSGAKNEQFKVTNTLFRWLDSLIGIKSQANVKQMLSLLRDTINQDGAEMCFAMFPRQIRMLIQAKENNFGAMAPFMIGKLKKQASTFTLDQLLKIHHTLLIIDIGHKTSSSQLNLTQELELLMVEM
jgi:DNA polymerase III delta subunit